MISLSSCSKMRLWSMFIEIESTRSVFILRAKILI
jgi:hypothetical protein